MKRKLVAAAVFVAVASMAFAGCGRRTEKGGTGPTVAATPVMALAARRAAIPNQIALTGTAMADRDSQVGPELGGNIAAMYVDIGDHVRAGQVLARLDSQLAAAQVSQSSALVRSDGSTFAPNGGLVRMMSNRPSKMPLTLMKPLW